MRPTIIGIMSRPELAAEVLVAICRDVGMKPIAANMATPSTNAMAVATMNTRPVNRCSGRIGSSARRSTNTRAMTHATVPTIMAIMPGESQAS